ncbi:hypothetical protein RBB79_19065 [Tunturiibacter empetritectus]|uniref:Uncharacterized protein n=2 Tax=Tunturiibacter TaxID=3154218 RepID=A0A852VJ58_9BACT|nr:hypothetical protein [Edaphobacter lichenicola]NYF91767.1 hypothetical protein [Edaphobacter lichenicola]
MPKGQLDERREVKANTGLSIARRTVRLSVASVEMTAFLLG